jgi:hypothetical protein
MRRCARPCKQPLTGMRPNARYATSACRTRHYRERKARGRSVTSQRRRSGAQVSYHKALRELHGVIPLPQWIVVECALKAALPPTQRELLEQRERAA